MDTPAKPGVKDILVATNEAKGVNTVIDNYLVYYNQKESDERQSNQKDMTNKYYDLATDFFEYGWGEAFHFATISRGESYDHAFAKHEYRLAAKIGMKAGQEVLDLGCGVGGPAREIASITKAKITGVNINSYQLERAKLLTQKRGLQNLCTFVEGDFCNMPFPDESYDHAYAIEATCHAGDRTKVFSEAYRVLRPGGIFASYEWILTDKYDPNNKWHKQIKQDILEGDSLPDLVTAEHITTALNKAGFEILEAADLALESEVPWYAMLEPRWSLSNFRMTPVGRWMTHLMLWGMETMRLSPRGSVKVHRMLCKGADGCMNGGREGIFTPMYCVLARKPPAK